MDAPEQIGRWAGPFAMFVTAAGAFAAFLKLLFNAGSWMQGLHDARDKVMNEIEGLKTAIKADTDRAEKADMERALAIKHNAETLHLLSERVGRIEGYLKI